MVEGLGLGLGFRYACCACVFLCKDVVTDFLIILLNIYLLTRVVLSCFHLVYFLGVFSYNI